MSIIAKATPTATRTGTHTATHTATHAVDAVVSDFDNCAGCSAHAVEDTRTRAHTRKTGQKINTHQYTHVQTIPCVPATELTNTHTRTRSHTRTRTHTLSLTHTPAARDSRARKASSISCATPNLSGNPCTCEHSRVCSTPAAEKQ